jgi:hypothetical protein
MVLPRRFGKTVSLLNQLLRRALMDTTGEGRYAYVAPYLKQAKSLAWDYLKKYADPVPGRTFSESELRLELPNGARIRLFGADNAEALRGIYLNGCVLDEYATIDPVVFTSILRPALADRQGWCVFSGTPNGKNHFYKLLKEAEQDPEWFTCVWRTSDIKHLPEKELLDAKKLMSVEEYDREFECSFESIIGKKIYPEFHHATHVSRTSLMPTGPTEIIRGWDNTGLSPAIVLTYLTATGQWRIFKEFCFSDCGIMDATESMILWCNMHLPPGCRFKDFSDPAGKNRDSIKMSPRDYIINKGRELGQDIWLVDGIQSWKPRRESVAGRFTRSYNGEPAILIDPSCEVIIEGFNGGYAYREMANLPGMFAEEAVKNHCSHIMDAIQYPATRLFMSGDHPTAGVNGVNYLDDEDSYGYSGIDQRQGRSALGGY